MDDERDKILNILKDKNGKEKNGKDIVSNGKKDGPSKHKRLISLDIIRGFTIALMIFVDDVGHEYPRINHSPWDDVTLADFVMPWFLFIVGTAMAFSFRKFLWDRESKCKGTWYALKRVIKLYVLGVII